MISSLLLAAEIVITADVLRVAPANPIEDAGYIYPECFAADSDAAVGGFELSSLESNYSIGEFLKELPLLADAEIDWEQTYAGITNDLSLYKQKVYFDPNADSDDERILFTQGGAVQINWHFRTANAGHTVVTQAYQIAESSDERPNRLYWTSAPFNGPTIDLSGKFVRLFGNTNLLAQTLSVDANSGVTNIVAGICLDERNAMMLEARAQVLDEDAQRFNGPRGQFVLAYYSDGTKSKFLSSVVVEVCKPEVKFLSRHVGDELLPTGDGWSIEGLLPYPKNANDGSISAVEGDDASPHMSRGEYVDSVSGNSVTVAYAVSPNDRTTRGYVENSPWKNDIFWEKPDGMGTLWPFEEVMYNVTWDEQAPFVVCSGDRGSPGLPIFIPTNYTVSVCDYQDPSGTAEVDGTNPNRVNVLREGRFTLKLTTTARAGKDVWYLPMQAKARTNPVVVNDAYSDCDVKYPIGRKLEPLDSAMGGSAAAAYAGIDKTLGGYIHASVSTDSNWNPRLYHEPVAPSLNPLADMPDDGDPFASLESSIYTVAVGKAPIEVWWRGGSEVSSRLFGTTAKITYPTAVQRYQIREAKRSEIREIALASKLGTDGYGYEPSAASLYLDSPGGWAEVSASSLPTLSENGFTYELDVNPAPGELRGLSTTGGLIAGFYAEDAGVALQAVGGTSSETNLCRLAATVFRISGTDGLVPLRAFTNDVSRSDWTKFSLSVAVVNSTNQTLTVRLGDAGETVSTTNVIYGLARLKSVFLGAYPAAGMSSATGFAIDNMVFREQDSVKANWTFEPGSLNEAGTRVRDATDFSRELELKAYTVIADYGAPVVKAGGVPYLGEVVPEVYRKLDQPGRHLNLAHAFTRLGDVDGSYATWAVRDDLGNQLSDSLVFTMYNDHGRAAQATYRVVATNEFYPRLESTVTVGRQMLPPAPLCYLDDYWNDRTSWGSLKDNAGNDRCIVYRDRKKNDWARRDGGGFAFYFYKPLDTFDWPDGEERAGYVPWRDFESGKPYGWYWQAQWPDDDEVPTMKVAQTLTKALDELPEVWNMASCAVVYPQPGLQGPQCRQDIVDLVDPTVAQPSSLEIETSVPVDYGFKEGPAGDCQLKQGKWYFTGLPPSISDRFYIDTSASPLKNMVLIGALQEPAAGNRYLQLNVLSADERQAIKDICRNAEPGKKLAWDAAVDALATAPVMPSNEREPEQGDWDRSYSAPAGVGYEYECRLSTLDARRQEGGADRVLVSGTTTGDGIELDYSRAYRPAYQPVDHYALMASGNDAGYVVLIENDSTNTGMVAEGDPIDMKVIRVRPELYNGTIMPLLDPMNKLSEMLTLQYNEPFGSATTNFTFQWVRRKPEADGSVNGNWDNWNIYAEALGLTSFTLGTNGTQLTELVNTYYAMRYRPLDGTAAALVCGTNWSDYCERTLAEGWVQRVLNAMTPFNQRVSDFYNHRADILYSMMEQIGGPYRGDVALNNDNLDNIGLLELYRTVFNKAEKMSLALGVSDVDVNKQLLLAASRIADLYMLLGAEAYSDAKNPLISQGTDTQYLEQLDLLPSSTFCFQNQVPTLLDEELALLRGRSNATQSPNMKTSPYYNRLVWNFTKGITEGEVAYVNNYGLRADPTGDITVQSAATQYPQGHGDAYGHYLSAIKGYYHLLRNEYFGWAPSMMEMMISTAVVNEDYTDEQKFADAAVKLAQTGLDTVDLTARKAWRDNGGDLRSAYFDDASNHYSGQNFDIVQEQHFGYGEFAARTGLGAAYNWMVVNSLLPTNDEPSAVYRDKGISQITRTTATQLDALAGAYKSVEDKLNSLDSGLNPLGLSQNAVPMDIDPTDLESRNSHFEQILERAEKALKNCDTVLAWANRYGARLQQLANAEANAEANQGSQELAYKNQLVAIYGTPYSGDIGPTGTYPQGYDGPDIYHYMWMDLGEFGVDSAMLRSGSTNIVLKLKTNYRDNIRDERGLISTGYDDVTKTKQDIEVSYTVAQNGIVLPPEHSGLRQMEGSIQSACREYLAAVFSLDQARRNYNSALKQKKLELTDAINAYNTKYQLGLAKNLCDEILASAKFLINLAEEVETSTTTAEDLAKEAYEAACKSAPYQVIGMANSIDTRAIVAASMMGPYLATHSATTTSKLVVKDSALAVDFLRLIADIAFDGLERKAQLEEARVSLIGTIREKLGAINSAAIEYHDAVVAMQAAAAAYRAEIAKGDQLRDEIANWRGVVGGSAAQIRYLDMFTRVQRNNVLTKYSTAFDTAQRYVWELAKVYDYETGLLSSDPQGAQKFYAEIIGSRQLGYEGVSTSAATDKGLYDIVNRMKENFGNLKGRLGINNPDQSAKEFSLRYECFRIDPGQRGDEAWKTELKKYWVDDINSNSEFARYCQPLAGSGHSKEPGLVIPFSTTIDTAKNLFGQNLQGGDHAYSSADYAVKISKVGVSFVGYDSLTAQNSDGLASEPAVYLVPVGTDYLRAPTPKRQVLGYRVLDQVLPLPYTIGSTELDDENWISTFSGLDGTSDSYARIRRHSTLYADGNTYSTRLCGRSVWNDKWLLVIPAATLNSNREQGLKTFINGVSDIKIGILAYSRSGN